VQLVFCPAFYFDIIRCSHAISITIDQRSDQTKTFSRVFDWMDSISTLPHSADARSGV
jgi:hypothetical protein